MAYPYLITASSASISLRAILCPKGMSSWAVTSVWPAITVCPFYGLYRHSNIVMFLDFYEFFLSIWEFSFQ